jgi:hypothetical protein
MQHHGKIIVIDEFEEDKHRQQIFEMFRSSSQRSGGRKLRGSANHEAISFVMRHIPWFAAINIGVRKQPDMNRFIMLDLNELPKNTHGKIHLPSLAKLHDLGQRMLAVALTKRAAAAELMAHLKTVSVPDVPGRVVENFSLPIAMFSAIYGLNRPLAEATMIDWLTQWDFTAQAVRDHVELMQEILTAEVMMEGGRRTTVSALLSEAPTPDVKSTLSRIGVKKIHKRGALGKTVLFICSSVVRRTLIKPGSEFLGHSIDQYLLRFNGAKKGDQKLGGEQNFTGIEVPYDVIESTFKNRKSEENAEDGNCGFE